MYLKTANYPSELVP